MNYFVIIRGPLGSGKTTIAKKVAQKLRAAYFGIDGIIEQNKLASDLENGYISQKSFLAANKILIPKARQFLKKGKPVVFDGNFYWKTQIEDLTSKLKFPHFVFTLVAPLETCVKRDAKRKQPYGRDAVEAVYRKTTSFTYGVEIDATNTKEKIIKEILSKLGK